MRGKIAAMYLRLSREDETGSGESQSIASQKLILQEYAAAEGLTELRWYIDDGYSGTNFDRPQFSRMIADIEAGLIGRVVTKDFSRLGRNYAGVGRLLDEYFPKKGVRYISLAEGIDTGQEFGSAGDLAPFLSVFNDMYARDISKKVRAALGARKKAGKFIGAAPPFGYRKDPLDHNRLVPDPEATAYIGEIFSRYLASGSLQETARQLSAAGVPTPSAYKGIAPGGRQAAAWSAQMLRRILTNPTYAGHLTQNWERTISYKVHKRVQMPPEERITVAHTHEGLISQEVFESAQKLLQVRGYSVRQAKKEHLLSGLVFCADCGSRMTYVTGGGERYYMACAASRRSGEARTCTSHLIREDRVIQAVCSALREICACITDGQLEAWAAEIANGEKRGISRAQKEQARREEAANALAMLYKDRAAGRIDEMQYRAIADIFIKEQAQVKQETEPDTAQLCREAERKARELLQFGELDKAHAAALIEKIKIGQDKKVEIIFAFTKPAPQHKQA